MMVSRYFLLVSFLFEKINIRSIRGVLLINIPLPPSDRLWLAFEDMPSIDFDVRHRQMS